jgi:hypothetical protein
MELLVNEFQTTSEILNRIFSNIDRNQLEQSNSVVRGWESIISKIYDYGPKLASHSRVIDLKNENLLIEVDHSGWIQILQLNKKFILQGLHNLYPELTIRNLSFKLKGQTFEQKAGIAEYSEERVKKEVEDRLDKIDKEFFDKSDDIEKKGITEKKVYNAEFEKTLERLKKEILTNKS